jgi:hypothetical protein
MSAKAHQYQTGGPRPFVVKLDVATRVFLMDSVNWSAYRGGRAFRPTDGGYFTRTPAVVNAPRGGTWWVVIEAPLGRPVHYEISA